MTPLVAYLLLFSAVGFGFILVHLLAGKLVRPNVPQAEKETIYECGEPTIGNAWVQFDLRYYVIALLFVIFDVEVAFFFPWAEVFGKTTQIAATPTENTELLDKRIAELQPHEGAKPVPSQRAEQKESLARFSKFALIEIALFFGILVVGFAYLWKRGDLAWVRSIRSLEPMPPPDSGPGPEGGSAVSPTPEPNRELVEV